MHGTDIDECEDEYFCSYVEGAECNNTLGSYACVCDPGYIVCGDSCIREKKIIRVLSIANLFLTTRTLYIRVNEYVCTSQYPVNQCS